MRFFVYKKKSFNSFLKLFLHIHLLHFYHYLGDTIHLNVFHTLKFFYLEQCLFSLILQYLLLIHLFQLLNLLSYVIEQQLVYIFY